MCERTDLTTSLPGSCPQTLDFSQEYKYCKDLGELEKLQFKTDGTVTKSSASGETFYWEYTKDCKVNLYLEETVTAEFASGSTTLNIPQSNKQITPVDKASTGQCEPTGLITALPAGCTQGPDFSQPYTYCLTDLNEDDKLTFSAGGTMTMGSKSGEIFYWSYTTDCRLTLYLTETMSA
jgi:hypothetical protein